MARSFHRRDRLEAHSQINITPLIDLCVALLIIFLISTPLLENQTIALNLPVETARPPPPKDDIRYQAVSIRADGRIYWGDRAVTASQLNDLLALLARDPDPPVIEVRGDAALPYQKIIDIIDLIKNNNLTKISLDTRSRKTGS